MDKRIIFPYNYKEDNREMFVKTFQLAELINAKVVLFTSIETGEPEEELDNVYHELFELNGFFQTHFNNWKKIKSPIERVIWKGDLGENLVTYLKNIESPVKVIVTQSSKELNEERLQNLFKKLTFVPKLIR